MVDAVFRFERCTHESFAKAFLKECCRRCQCGQLKKGTRVAKKKKTKKNDNTAPNTDHAATKEAENDDDGEGGEADHFQTSRQVSSF